MYLMSKMFGKYRLRSSKNSGSVNGSGMHVRILRRYLGDKIDEGFIYTRDGGFDKATGKGIFSASAYPKS